MVKRVSAEEFKHIVKDIDFNDVDAELPEVVVRKFAAATPKTIGDSESRVRRFIVSTADVDRDGDTIDPAGWELDNFRMAGSMLWAHDIRLPPVASPTRIDVKEMEGADGAFKQALVMDAEFAPPDMPHPFGTGFGHSVMRMFDTRLLRAVSAGFLPKEFNFNETRGGFMPTDFKVQELLEASATPVPSNPNALHVARSMGIDVAPIAHWAEFARDKGGAYSLTPDELTKMLDAIADPKAMSLPARDSMKNEKTVISFQAAHAEGTPLAPDDQEWDGPAEVADADVEQLQVMSAWREDKAEEDLIKGDFKLPHHEGDGEHRVVFRGVAATMGALLGARGGVDIPEEERRGVYEHLARHYEEFGRGAPEFREYSEDELRGLVPEAFEAKEVEAEEDEELNIFEQAEAAEAEAISKAVELIEEVHERGRVLSVENRLLLKTARRLIDQLVPQPKSTKTDESDALDLEGIDTLDELAEFLGGMVDQQIQASTGRLPD